MAGVKIEQGTLTHRKTLRLKGLLGIGVAQAVGHLTMLWVWAASSTKDGSLAGMTPTEIAEVSGWAGEPADFLAAMIDAGYIDEAPGGFRLHDWAENTGQIEAEARREAARERQRRFKERKRAEKAAEAARAEASKVPAPQQKPLVVAPQPPQRTEPRTDPELARAGQFYLNNINPTPPRWELEDLTQAVAEFGADVVIRAMEIAQRNKAPNWKYTRGVLARYREKDVKDLAAAVDADKWTKEEARNGKAGRYDRQRDAVPATQNLAGFHTA